jgi:hypothetical protein
MTTVSTLAGRTFIVTASNSRATTYAAKGVS